MTNHCRAIPHMARLALVAPLWLGATAVAWAQSSVRDEAFTAETFASPWVPRLSATSVVESGASTCGLAMTSRVSASWNLARVTTISAPLLQQPTSAARAPVLAFDVRTPSRSGWGLRAASTVGAASAQCATQSEWTRGWVQVTRTMKHGGVALSLGARSLAALDPSRDRQGVTASLWQQRGSSWYGIDVRSGHQRSNHMSWFNREVMRPDSSRDSLNGGWNRFNRTQIVPDSGLTTQRAQSIDIRTRWQRQLKRAAFDFTVGGTGMLGGQRAGTPPRDSAASPIRSSTRIQLWARADTRIALTRSSAVIVGIAALPSQPLLGSRASRVFSLAVALTTGARDYVDSIGHERVPSRERREFDVQRLTPDSAPRSEFATGDSVTVRLRVRSRGAQQVEVSGEPFAWKPVRLERTRGDWWESVVTMKAGTYRMSVRFDGAQWMAPPGLPPLQDEFGGEVALVTVR